MMDVVRTVKQFLTYVNGAPFQPAVAVGLGLPDEFFAGAASDPPYGETDCVMDSFVSDSRSSPRWPPTSP